MDALMEFSSFTGILPVLVHFGCTTTTASIQSLIPGARWRKKWLRRPWKPTLFEFSSIFSFQLQPKLISWNFAWNMYNIQKFSINLIVPYHHFLSLSCRVFPLQLSFVQRVITLPGAQQVLLRFPCLLDLLAARRSKQRLFWGAAVIHYKNEWISTSSSLFVAFQHNVNLSWDLTVIFFFSLKDNLKIKITNSTWRFLVERFVWTSAGWFVRNQLLGWTKWGARKVQRVHGRCGWILWSTWAS